MSIRTNCIFSVEIPLDILTWHVAKEETIPLFFTSEQLPILDNRNFLSSCRDINRWRIMRLHELFLA